MNERLPGTSKYRDPRSTIVELAFHREWMKRFISGDYNAFFNASQEYPVEHY